MNSDDASSLGGMVPPPATQRGPGELEALLLLASGFCHDINNALGAALGFVEMAREDIPPTTTAHQDLGGAVDSLARAIGLIGYFRSICQRGPRAGQTRIPLIPLLKEFGKRLGCGQRGQGGRWLQLPEDDLVGWAELWGLHQALSGLFPGWPDDCAAWEWNLSLSRGRPPVGGEADGQTEWAVFRLEGPDLARWTAATLPRLGRAWERLGGGAAAPQPGLLAAWLPLAPPRGHGAPAASGTGR